MKRNMILTSSVAALTLAVGLLLSAQEPTKKKPDEAALERTRKVVRMLDDIYKQSIVLITDKYVQDEDDYPAGSAFVKLFEVISKSKSGNHQVRLIDATGKPYEPENIAKDNFEKDGIKRLKAGESTVEQVIEKDGKLHLRTLTPVPVVMKKCVMCHEHYADAKQGEPIGAISYIVPID